MNRIFADDGIQTGYFDFNDEAAYQFWNPSNVGFTRECLCRLDSDCNLRVCSMHRASGYASEDWYHHFTHTVPSQTRSAHESTEKSRLENNVGL
mmetsp:Transcript_24016/g.27692  ORF Transcript_24016/g.27692 Transcript_24016/m.27692 type:complete len:94 (-) Transcript_24016:1914-2195(-)